MDLRLRAVFVSIITLIASGKLIDLVLGLEIGADDYVSEPSELVARVKAVLRRTTAQGSPAPTTGNTDDDRLSLGEYPVDLNSRELTDENGDVIVLTTMEFNLLAAFAETPDKVLTRDKLLSLIHKDSSDPFDRSIDIRIG